MAIVDLAGFAKRDIHILMNQNGVIYDYMILRSGWWFGTWLDYDFPYIGNDNPNWLSYFSDG